MKPLPLALITLVAGSALSAQPEPALSYAPLVGAVTPTSFDVHVRSTTPATLQVDIDGQLTEPVTTTAARDFTARFAVTGLAPETTYTYRVLVDGLPGSTWHTVTTFPPETDTRSATLAVMADALTNGQYSVYGRVADDLPDLLLQIGDWPHGDPKNCVTALPVGVPAVTCWWQMYRSVIADSFSAWTSVQSIPFVYTWDDHDFGVNDGSRTFKWRASALQATNDYIPSYPRPNPTQGRWQSFRYGSSIEIFVLDLRYQKDPKVSYDRPGMPDQPAHSMLNGANIVNDQKTWLKAGLLASTATWKLVLSSLSFNPTVAKTDAWHGYQTESRELRAFIAQNQIGGVIILSGDIHSGGGIDDGRYAGLPEITVPKTNIPFLACTTPCGSWSAGVVNPRRTAGGYVLVETVGDQSLTAIIKDDGGLELLRGTWDALGGFTSVATSKSIIYPVAQP